MYMKKTAISAVLLDFGGVLADEGFHNGLIALADEQGLEAGSLISAGMQAVYDSGFVLGHGTSAQFWQLMRLRTGLTGEDSELTQRILDGFEVRPWMIQRVKDLHEHGYVTGILSDQTNWLDILDEQYHFSDVFDHVYNSYYMGKGKRDPSLFTYVANDLGMNSAKILFVDDNAGNVQRARDAGMQALLYVDREGFLSDLDKELSKN
jgi:putative hydrolase of the HAD superfamily